MTIRSGEKARDIRPTLSWRFPKAFWVGNVLELFERAAFYGIFIVLTLFLTDVVGFTDVQTAWIVGPFAASLYILPFITGAAADRMGFRSALILAFALLTCGYASLGLFTQKMAVLLALPLIVVGGAFVKPIISGTVAKCSSENSRARAFSIFYMVVNIGAFSGKAVAKPVRTLLGLEYVPLYSAGAAAIALVLVALFYWPKKDDARPRSAAESAPPETATTSRASPSGPTSGARVASRTSGPKTAAGRPGRTAG